MFSGIVEAKSAVVSAQNRASVVVLQVARPPQFNDLKLGDSVCINGVCLTVEVTDETVIQFALAAETLQVTQWTLEGLRNASLNLERSLRFGDRIHGHLVSGHVDQMGEVVGIEDLEETRFLKVAFPEEIAPCIWKKGSVTLNGVSLTVNQVEKGVLEVCLIPETLERTNLGDLKMGDRVTMEVDMFARGLLNYFSHHQDSVQSFLNKG
ncbi:MAG: riboflavin synthase [Bdellovibrionales bacterium]|nr:riboflavin synthase [Bdellovibrionales bacterium]